MSTPAADIAPQSIPNCDTKLVRPTGSVCALSLEVRVRDQEVVPGEEERNDRAANARGDERAHDLHENAECACPVHQGGFLDLFRQVLDEAHRQPDRDRKLGEKAEAQEATELLYARVVLPATPPFGGADGEPDLVADGCAINGLKHQFEREALLHLADHDEFG